jgi:hypothetical protein
MLKNKIFHSTELPQFLWNRITFHCKSHSKLRQDTKLITKATECSPTMFVYFVIYSLEDLFVLRCRTGTLLKTTGCHNVTEQKHTLSKYRGSNDFKHKELSILTCIRVMPISAATCFENEKVC